MQPYLTKQIRFIAKEEATSGILKRKVKISEHWTINEFIGEQILSAFVVIRDYDLRILVKDKKWN